MATQTLYSVEDYLKGDIEEAADWDVDYEYVDGEIEERYLGEVTHADWQRAIAKWLDAHEVEWNIRVRSEVRLQVTPTRFRVPDVMVWSRSNAREEIIRLPPIAVFEVLSPEDRMSRALLKLKDYAAMGIGTIRVVDPRNDQILRFVEGRIEPVDEQVEGVTGTKCLLDWTRIREIVRS